MAATDMDLDPTKWRLIDEVSDGVFALALTLNAVRGELPAADRPAFDGALDVLDAALAQLRCTVFSLAAG